MEETKNDVSEIISIFNDDSRSLENNCDPDLGGCPCEDCSSNDSGCDWDWT